MKKENLADGISHIDDDLIEQAADSYSADKKKQEPIQQKTYPSWRYRTVFAAGVAVVLISALTISKQIQSPKLNTGSVRPTVESEKGNNESSEEKDGVNQGDYEFREEDTSTEDKTEPGTLTESYDESNLPYQKDAIATVSYPKSYSYDDVSTWITLVEENPVKESFENAVKQFSYQTAAKLLQDKGKNQLYSPLSLYYALSLATAGANGTTQEELLSILGVPTIEQLGEQCGNLYRILYKDNEYSTLRIANSIWMNQVANGVSLHYNKDYLEQAVNNYYASVYSVDFSSADTASKIGSWIAKNTNNTLGKEYSIEPNQVMSIINTIYLYDQWVDRFNQSDITQGTFYKSNGETVRCDYLNRKASLAEFTRGEGYLSSSLALKNVGRMVFVLPDKGVSIEELLATPENIEKLFNPEESVFGKIVWKVPKFSYGASLDLKYMLQELGVNQAFTSEADFSKLVEEVISISNIRQDTHIAIDENGVEASAYTEIQFNGSAMPEDTAEMILDRPFIYGIMTNDGVLSFIGVCNTPNEK